MPGPMLSVRAVPNRDDVTIVAQPQKEMTGDLRGFVEGRGISFSKLEHFGLRKTQARKQAVAIKDEQPRRRFLATVNLDFRFVGLVAANEGQWRAVLG